MRDDIDRRLGWTRDLISDDPAVREQALLRYGTAVARYVQVLREFYADHRTVRPRLDEAASHLMPHAVGHLTEFSSQRAGALLEYMIVYLRWEALHPDEWTWHAKNWGAKLTQLRLLTRHAHELPPSLLPQLADLIVAVVARPQRVNDEHYARLARRLPREPLYGRLSRLHQSGDPGVRERAGYLLWLLDHPQQAVPKPSQWRRYLLEHHGRTERPHPAVRTSWEGRDAFAAGTVVVCPRCAAPALTSRVPTADVYGPRRRLACLAGCPPVEGPIFVQPALADDAVEVDVDFGAALWLQRRCRDGRTVWARHARHLDAIEQCVMARGQSSPGDAAWPSPYVRVPGWMSTTRYRDEVLTLIAELRATLPADLRGPGPDGTIEA